MVNDCFNKLVVSGNINDLYLFIINNLSIIDNKLSIIDTEYESSDSYCEFTDDYEDLSISKYSIKLKKYLQNKLKKNSKKKVKFWYKFCSAWTPPIFLIDNFSIEYTNLKFSLQWSEPGMCLYGKHVYIHGDLSKKIEYKDPDMRFSDNLNKRITKILKSEFMKRNDLLTLLYNNSNLNKDICHKISEFCTTEEDISDFEHASIFMDFLDNSKKCSKKSVFYDSVSKISNILKRYDGKEIPNSLMTFDMNEYFSSGIFQSIFEDGDW